MKIIKNYDILFMPVILSNVRKKKIFYQKLQYFSFKGSMKNLQATGEAFNHPK